ncbi:MAG: helix-turn-helix domain-containing protein, partial [Caldiserica bacterium]|nr:helix-turn-helix domain-containing protein [Caldisericota bacterium]
RARILLRSHEGEKKDALAERLSIGRSTVQRIRDRYRKGGLEHALHENPRPGAPRRLTESGEAHLIAIACTNPPEGYGHWTMDLLKKQLVKDGKAP